MSNFFNMDNPIFSVLSKICDMLFISVVWILLCIPVFTIGPAITALYYTVVKVIRRERGYLFREFFHSFRTNFKCGAIVGVILTVVFSLLAFDISMVWGKVEAKGSHNSIMLGIFFAITLLVLCFTIYVFPVLSRFDMSVKQLMKAAVFMSIKHLPYTLAMAVITVLFIVGTVFLPFIIFFSPATCVLLVSLLMEHVLKKYIPKSDVPPEESGKDEWYLE